MRRMLVIVKREYLAAVKTKGFLIGLVIAPFIMGGSAIVMFLLRDQVDTTDKRIVVVDRSAKLGQTLVEEAARRNAAEVIDSTTGSKIRPAYLLTVEQPDTAHAEAQRLALSERVRAGELDGFLEIGSSVLHPDRDSLEGRIIYHAKNTVLDEARRWMNGALNARIRLLRLEEAGLSENDIPDLFWWVPVEGHGLVTQDASGNVTAAKRQSEIQALVVPLFVAVLMVLIIMMGAAPQLNAVMEEKTQRIAEVVLGLATPFEFMMGKVLGGLCVSLTASIVYIVVAVVLLTGLGQGGMLPLHIIPWFLIMMVFAILMMGAVYAALGSLCSDPKDAQSLTFPGLLPILIPMFVLIPVIREPRGIIATVLSLVPPFTPVLMTLRLTTPEGVPAWQLILGMVLVAGTMVFSVWVASRIFRVALLAQGQIPGLRRVVRWALGG